jgi:23S rRNA pseudouridine1911/1915/1917 synthase
VSEDPPIEIEIDERFAGERLDRALTLLLDDRSRALIQKHIEAGAVSIDGAPPKQGAKTKLYPGAVIRYQPPPPEPLELVAEEIPLSILFEDEHMLVIDKPAGLVVHPAAGHPRGTLVNAVLHHLQADLQGVGSAERPGIVHRLDRDTTGVIAIAKTARAHELLGKAFSERRVDKMYLAVAHGVPSPEQGTIDTWYGRHPRDRKRFSSKVMSGKRAVTHYRVSEKLRGASSLEIHLETGRTHQIRVHFADKGHPLVGDPVYGTRKALAPFDRPALHSYRLSLEHPITGRKLTCEAPIPQDLLDLVEALR